MHLSILNVTATKKQIIFFVLSFGLLNVGAVHAGPYNHDQYLKAQDLAWEYFRVPPFALDIIKCAEGGWDGAKILNNNGSYDFGVFQINSAAWAPSLQRNLGFSAEEIRTSTLHNTIAAAYILRIERNRTTDWYEAMGNYHRHARDQHRDRYQKNVISCAERLLGTQFINTHTLAKDALMLERRAQYLDQLAQNILNFNGLSDGN